MGKSTLIICIVNMIASAVALFFVFHGPGKARMVLATPQNQAVQPAAPAPPPETVWREFAQAGDMQTAAFILGKLPATETALAQAADYVGLHRHADGKSVDFGQTGRVAGCLQFLAGHIKWESPHLTLLESVAEDRQCRVILRDLALRGVIEAALRKQNDKDSHDDAWRIQLADFLMKPDFGTETSMEGLSLQAASFAQSNGLAAIDSTRLAARLQGVLAHQDSVQEDTLIAALEVCASTPETHLADVVRAIVQNPRSDAVLQTAVATLGKIGTVEDQALLARMNPKSAALYRTAETAWLDLTPRKHTP